MLATSTCLYLLDATSKFPNGILQGGFADLGAYDQCIDVLHIKDSGQTIKGCKIDLDHYMKELRQLKTWAVMMLDATSKFPNGILQGGFADLGAYDQCIDVLHIKDSGQTIKGQYCTLHIYPPLPPKPRFYPIYQHVKELRQFIDKETVIGHISQMAQYFYSEPFRWSICLPSTCLKQDVQQLANTITPFTDLYPEVTNCEIKEIFKLSTDQICAIFVLGVLFLVTIIGSWLDVHLTKDNNEIKALGTWKDSRLKYVQIIRCFSIISNGKKIFNVSDSDGIPVLHGIRVFTMLWIILCHTYLYNNLGLYGKCLNCIK
ncbi:nose resistant to fluoxetine protein 6-like [Centruroides sculpturatus]|uniref:nose resistant to fluoxetine protein 6-like n=1 Tax=Centruroides sculpturatus TaxID=218467 RepID=UPI000C6F0158|nr:nose resistant to fluoxetine protein 6-like [Centruroides sculpturatus]